MLTSIRNLDQKTFRRFKVEAKRRDQAIARALEEAMRLYLGNDPRRLKLIEMPTEDWGPRSRHDSRRVDELAYGDTN